MNSLTIHELSLETTVGLPAFIGALEENMYYQNKLPKFYERHVAEL